MPPVSPIAAEQGCDPFEVSVPLLLKQLPKIILKRQHPVVWAKIHQHDQDLFRPSSRYQVIVPDPPLHDYVFPPPDLRFTRLGHYREYEPRPHRAPRRKPHEARSVLPHSLKPVKQLSLFSGRVLRQLLQVDK